MTRRTDPRLQVLTAHALAHGTPWPADVRAVIEGGTFDPPPWNVVLGPVLPRHGPAGAVAVGGRTVAEWGPADATDMAFSVTKSYIGLLAAVALDRGLIDDLDAPVAARIDDPAFASPRNAQATWRRLLDQTSEWSGTLFGIPDTVDRDRQLAPTDDPARFNRATPLRAPGAYWDYNDIRVNALCLALTRLFGRPLPDVLAGLHPAFAARDGWAWHGYGAASRIALGGGREVEVAVGGGHWGGGFSGRVAHHMALGGIVLGRGKHAGTRVVSAEALGAVLAPCPLQPVYGGLWWLNTSGRLYPSLPQDSVLAMGVGATVVWVCPSRDVVAVLRWIVPGAAETALAAILEVA